MNHPLERYWKKAFADYRLEENCYHVPGMEDPILSPRFYQSEGTHLNLIQKKSSKIKKMSGYKLRNNFYLGRFQTKALKPKEEYRVVDLVEGSCEKVFWDLMKDGFSKDYSFLKGLVEFLPKLKAKFKLAYLGEKDNPYACTLLGIAGEDCVLLSGVIHSKYRGQKKTRELEKLIHLVAFEEKVRECFFWTLSPQLLNYADHIDRYLIYTQE